LLGVLLNLFGILGSVAVSVVMTKTGIDFLKANKLVAMCSLLFIGLFWVLIDKTNWTKASTSLFGFFNLPIFFVAYELAVEQTVSRGLGEALPCGVINMLANGISFVVVVSLTPILSG
jgi:hypothetical protein